MNFDKNVFLTALENQVTATSTDAINKAIEARREEEAKAAAERVVSVLRDGSARVETCVSELRRVRRLEAEAKKQLGNVGLAHAWAKTVGEDGNLMKLVPLIQIVSYNPREAVEQLGLNWDEVKDTEVPKDFDPTA